MPTNPSHRRLRPSSFMAVAVDHCHGFKPPSTGSRRCRLRSYPHPNPVLFDPDTPPPSASGGLPSKPTPKFSRSLSTPCLYTTAISPDEPRTDHIARIEIVAGRRSRTIHALVVEAAIALASGASPVPVSEGLSAAHYLFNRFGESFAVVKPVGEEPSLPLAVLGRPSSRYSTHASETGVREVAAYLLDHGGFSGVPPTALIMITRPASSAAASSQGDPAANQTTPARNIASIQRFVPHEFDAGELGPSRFSVTSVHRIGILDIRILNVDRHAGNILVKKGSGCCCDGGSNDSTAELVPIDHGLCLPDLLDDPYFEWLHWPQASVPFSESEAEYVSSLDPFRDAELLRVELPSLRESCLRILVICTIFLKRAVEGGLCLADIGHMMTREFSGLEEGPSEFEALCKSVEDSMRNTTLALEDDSNEEKSTGDDEARFQFDMEDADGFPESRIEDVVDVPLLLRRDRSKEEQHVLNEEGTTEENDEGSVKEHKLGGLAKSYSFAAAVLNVHDGSRSISFEGLSEEEWSLFLERFEKLLPEAFEARKSMGLKQRLGTSCKF